MNKQLITFTLLLLAVPSESKQLEAHMKKTNRSTDYAIEDLILHRWSPRSMSGESISHDELMRLFEAARWAPSSSNNQPWRFWYVKRDSKKWQSVLDLLVPFNQAWAKEAGALIIIASKNNFEHNNQPSRTSAFDTGAAWQNLALQGTAQGLVVHPMEGFSYQKAKELLGLNDDYTIQAMVAIGKPAPRERLPEEMQEREKPSSRKSISEIVHEI